jgi:carboxyl-terminal processing protease
VTIGRLAILGLLFLTACGGGGGGGGSTSASASSSFAPSSSLAAQCAVPRTGIDPTTGISYPDRPGTLLDEQNWLASWTNELYLWYGEVTYKNPTAYASATAYFDVLKTPNRTPSGQPKDRFHFTYPTAIWEALAQSGIQPGYGATWTLIGLTPPRSAVVAYTEPGSPATAAGLSRGAQILQVDGVDLVNDTTYAGVTTLNAGLFPASAGETHHFVVRDLGAATTRTITMVSADVVSAPVQNVTTLAGGTIGYMLFNDHLATAEPALIGAMTQLQAAHVSDLILDVRYNSGGLFAIASELAYMIAGPTATRGKIFESFHLNDKHPVPQNAPFYSTAGGFASTPAGTVLPHLDLARVYVLTGADSCSATESVVNGLRGVGIEVIQIGSTTCGKPYGFYPADNCGTTYFTIQVQGVNAQGFGDYADGFVPANGATGGIAAGAILPGCSVADDFTHALGDPAESRLAAALQYRANGTCPAASGVFLPRMARAVAPSEGHVVKSPFLTNRIMGR